MEFITSNWEYVLLAFYVLEKVVRLSPTKSDDIIFYDKHTGNTMQHKDKSYIIITVKDVVLIDS